ncbi:hypothetical protein K443DRAFT_104663 [Laccaria amethystina LaAM-08-1]|uniref:Major facilitator superfamily (MFS) profile domain-containing protein n=1 Tax=Laccaria amethystina LaAM-08-1 TaxID=1095629 RepID=A0A0C9XKE3_9AGAR|nr:hypothetical protein K443DRAFT_104663 [Laccaria amethystina LaAM-08-1]
MTVVSFEREPLLREPSSRSSSTPRKESDFCPSSLQPAGPLDISASSRQGILAGIWLAQFLSLFLNILAVLPAISSDFNKSNEASWVGTSYLLATCTFTPLYGRLSDVMGRGRANKLAIFFAAVGILACGLSNSMQMLIISRFISGLGGGGIFTTSAIITSDMYNMRSRGFIQSIGGMFYGLGMGLGGPLGGLITDWLGWRWAFLIQIPLFAIAFSLTTYNLNYVISERRRSTLEVLKRIDYGGTLALLISVGSMLFFLSMRYNESLPWSDASVWVSLLISCVAAVLFIIIEVYVAVEPVLPPVFLTKKVPVLVGCSNALVAVCNLSVTYFFPTWFQTVMLSSASTAGDTSIPINPMFSILFMTCTGLHLLPNSFCISTGSFFAGWMMRRTGRYKAMSMTFGCLPFLAAILMTQMREDSSSAHLWLSIIPLGFGNAVVLQTMFIALVSHLPESQLAVGTGFAQLLRGLGQVGGLAASSAVFQSRLESELRARLPAPNSENLIQQIRQSAKLVASLPPDIQRIARDSYAASLKSVFVLAACASLFAYLARVPVSRWI